MKEGSLGLLCAWGGCESDDAMPVGHGLPGASTILIPSC